MKKLILMLAIVLPVLASAQKTTPQVIACVSSQEVLMLMPEVKTVSAKLDSVQTSYENLLLNMQEEMNKKVAEFQQQQASMSATVRDFRQQELADLEQRIQKFYQSVQQDLQAKQVEYMQPVQQKLLDAINKVAAAKGCTYVMEKGAMLYTGPAAIDLTAAVKAELGIK
jgi:outer membrane protein